MPGELTISLQEISDAAQKNRQETELLTRRIKRTPLNQLDKIAAPVIRSVTSRIDCTRCGNCCRVQEPGVSKEEISRLATLSHQPVEEFKNERVAYDKEGTAFLCQQPCSFLDGNKCSIYADRPASCADFPGLERPRLKWRWKRVMENYTICPIVFHVVEELKKNNILKNTAIKKISPGRSEPL